MGAVFGMEFFRINTLVPKTNLVSWIPTGEKLTQKFTA